MSILNASVVGFFLVLSAGSIAGTPPSYHVAEVGSLVDDQRQSRINHLNENGDAVGEMFLLTATQGLIYTYEHGPMLLPPIDGLVSSRAVEVTDRDEQGEVIIVGSAGTSAFDPNNTTVGVGCYWRYSTVTGMITESGLIGPLPSDASARATGVNNNGIVVGWSRASDFGAFTPILFDVNTDSLSPLTFPALPVDINNNGQVAGGTFIGDTMGNATDIGIPNDTTSASIVAINDQGWVVATVSRPFTDGAGRFVTGAARFTGTWRIIWSNSAFDNASDINESGDIVGLLGISSGFRPAVFYDDINEVHLVNNLLGPMEVAGEFSAVGAINTNKQLGVGFPFASVFTPLGQMIISGDVNGDAEVTSEDLCDWLASPVDLDGDGDADGDDEMFLIGLLELLGIPVDDCNGNGIPDHCDILSGFSNDCNENFVPDECEPDCDGDGLPDSCESDCNKNGVPDDCDIADGTSDDCNGNGIPDECDVSDTVFTANNYDPPLPLFSDLPFDDNLFVTTNGTIQDVEVVLDMNFRVGQVTARLSHAGVTVTIIDRPGVTPQNPLGFTNLGYRIVLDDEGAGANIQNVGATVSVFESIESPPSYRPTNPLSAFDGLPREGEWILELDLGFAQTFNPAMLNWGVSVTDTEVSVGECVCAGDCDESGIVEFDDLICMLFQFNTSGTNEAADCDQSGVVDFNDLICALFGFGSCY